MPVVWSPDTRLHEPRHEIWVGAATPAVEVPARVDAILAALDGRPRHGGRPGTTTRALRVHDGGSEHLASAAGAGAGPYDERPARTGWCRTYSRRRR